MRKIIVTGIIFLFAVVVDAAEPVVQPKVFVLCYHTFLSKPKIPTDFSIDEFRAQIQILRNEKVAFVQWKDVVSGKLPAARNAVIIIDDGNISGYRAYNEVLKPLGIRPVFAIFPNVISHVKYAMTWPQVLQVQQDGCEIAAHGYYHMYLNEKYLKEQPREFQREIVDSKEVLEKKLGKSVGLFVYPFGVHCAPAVDLIKASKYNYAFTILAGDIDRKVLKTDQRWTLPRLMVTRPLWRSYLAKVTGKSL